jgi:hypothetical protein
MEYTGIFDFPGASRLEAECLAGFVSPPVCPTYAPCEHPNKRGGGGGVSVMVLTSACKYIFIPSLPRPAYKPTRSLAHLTTSTTNNNLQTTTPSPSSSPSISAIVGGVVFLAVFLLRGHCKNKAPEPKLASAELPSYQDRKDMNTNAVEIGAFSHPLAFTPYIPRPPQEVDASHDEEHHTLPDGSMGATPRIESGSPQMGSSSRFSEVSMGTEEFGTEAREQSE